jgi:hypothetical protein
MIEEGNWDDFGSAPIEFDGVYITVFVNTLGTTRRLINRLPERPVNQVAQELATILKLESGDWKLWAYGVELKTSIQLNTEHLYDLYDQNEIDKIGKPGK